MTRLCLIAFCVLSFRFGNAQLIDQSIMQRMDSSIKTGVYPNIHSVLVSINNKLVYENYWPGNDEVWGDSIGFVQHGRDSLHDIRSVSKSIVSACIGIAIKQGRIKNVEQRVFDFFPEHKKYDTGAKSQLSIKHLLSMTSGLVWNEDIPYSDPQNSEIRMIESHNQVEFVLSQPMEVEPGKKWKYNGGTTQLLAAIIKKTTGKSIDAFAEEYLFRPLGITKYQWVKYPGTDIPAAASGLRLRPVDMVTFGLLYINEGKANSKQILSPDWVKESLTAHVSRGNDEYYGYQFWLFNATINGKKVQREAAVGNGDQRIFINREAKVVVVVTAGNYNKWNIANGSVGLLINFVYPALEAAAN